MSSPFDFSEQFGSGRPGTSRGAPGARPQGSGPQGPNGWNPAGSGAPSGPGGPAAPGGRQPGPGGFRPGGAPTGPPAPDVAPTGATTAVAYPPLVFLWVLLGCSVLGGLLAWILNGPLTLIGWLVAGPAAVAVLGIYHRTDIARRSRPLYARTGSADLLYWAGLVVCGLGVLASAVAVALWIGRI
ncbi:hypothetical protein [Brevibacterium litoralis]|uniref:hypothetical protein n=1 Tax=Brevibacterium litoralis TaxID=3138935 RepID=UPI0032EBF840